jgi:hypothetical protein
VVPHTNSTNKETFNLLTQQQWDGTHGKMAEAGVSSALALFYFAWVLLSSYILTWTPYAQLFPLKLYQYFTRLKWNPNSLGKLLCLTEFLYSISSISVLIILAVLTSQANSAIIAMNIFLIGITLYFIALSFFALYHSEWHPLQIFNIVKYLAVLFFSLFLFFQLFFPGVRPSYRYNGVLWIGLSAIVLLSLTSVMKDRKKETTSAIPQIFVIHPCRSSVFARSSAAEYISKFLPTSVTKTFELLESRVSIKEYLLWIFSLILFFCFCLTVTVTVPHGSISFLVFGVCIVIEIIVGYLLSNTYFDYNLESVCWTICTFRFLLVLSGPDYWLFGCTVVLMLMSGVVALSIIHKVFPQSGKKDLAFDILMNAIKSKSKSSDSAVDIESKDSHTEQSQHTEGHIKTLNHLYEASPLSLDIASLVILQFACFVVFMIDGFASPSLSPKVEGWKQSTWGCLLWVGWVVTICLHLCSYGVRNGGFSSRSYQHYKVVNFLRSFYGQVRTPAVDNAMLPEIPIHGVLPILCLASWILVVGWFSFLAVLVKRWVLIPCAAFIPLAIVVYVFRLIQWIHQGCQIPTQWKEIIDSIRVHVLLQQPSDLHVDPKHTITGNDTLLFRLLRSWLFPYLLLWLPVAICSGIVYFYPVLYLVLWLTSISFCIVSIFRWRLTLEIDTLFGLLLIAQWLPLIIWAIVAARQTDAFDHSIGWIVTVLGLAALSVEMFALNLFMWRDISNQSIDFSTLPGKQNYPKFLKLMILTSFCLLTLAFTILASTLSPAIGVFALFLMMSFFFFILSYYRIHSLAGYRTHLTCAIILLILCSGIYGIIFHYNLIFWWFSISWLSLAFIFFLSGIRNDLSSTHKIYGFIYFPVQIQSSTGELVDCSFQASGILISLVMICLWALWLRVLESSEIGGIIYILSLVILYIYIRRKSSSSSSPSSLLQSYLMSQELLCGSLEYALKKIDLVPPTKSNSNLNSPNSPSPDFPALQLSLTQLLDNRDTQFRLLDAILSSPSSASLLPFVNCFILLFNSFVIPKEQEALLQELSWRYDQTLRLMEQIDEFYGYFRLNLIKEIFAFHSIQQENLVSFLRSCDTPQETFEDLSRTQEDEDASPPLSGLSAGHVVDSEISFSTLLPSDLLKFPTDKLILLLQEYHNYETQLLRQSRRYESLEVKERDRLEMREALMRRKEEENKLELLEQEKYLESQVLENEVRLREAEEELKKALEWKLLLEGDDEEEEGESNDLAPVPINSIRQLSNFPLHELSRNGHSHPHSPTRHHPEAGAEGHGNVTGHLSLNKSAVVQLIQQSQDAIRSISKESERILKLRSNSKRILESKTEDALVGSFGKPLEMTLVRETDWSRRRDLHLGLNDCLFCRMIFWKELSRLGTISMTNFLRQKCSLGTQDRKHLLLPFCLCSDCSCLR